MGLANVGSIVGVAGWLAAQAARTGTKTVKTIQCLFMAEWNGIRRDWRDGNSADNPTLFRVKVDPHSARYPDPIRK